MVGWQGSATGSKSIFEPEISKVDKEKAMEAREGFYQTQLKTLERYGGMNTLDSNHILFKICVYFSCF